MNNITSIRLIVRVFFIALLPVNMPYIVNEFERKLRNNGNGLLSIGQTKLQFSLEVCVWIM